MAGNLSVPGLGKAGADGLLGADVRPFDEERGVDVERDEREGARRRGGGEAPVEQHAQDRLGPAPIGACIERCAPCQIPA